MKKEYLIILSILLGSIIVATARQYMGTTYELRAKLKVCEEHYQAYIKKIEKCKKAARFGNLGN